MYPLFLRMTGRLAVVIGGGPVGRRKAAGLLQADAHVRLACLEPRPADLTAPNLDWLTETYKSSHLEGAALVFAAATPEVNRAVIADAQARGLWACSATEPESGDFVTASTIRRGDLIVALGTGGQVPALTRAMRERLESILDDQLGEWLALLAELRPVILQRIADLGRRRQLWECLCDRSWLERLRSEGVDRVRGAMLEMITRMAEAAEPLI